MATDIAFLLGLLTVLGRRVPVSLKVFYTALAIADDLGAVLVITLFYTAEIELTAVLVAAVILAALIVLNRGHVRNPMPYALLGIGLWLAFLESGIHPTVAGVLLALTIPARIGFRTEAFLAQCTAALGGLRSGTNEEEGRQQQAAAQTLEVIAERIQSPLQRMERALNPWVAYLIVPLFAFANAGVVLSGNVEETVTSPIFLGIVGGLVLGKPLGITLFSWIAVKTGIAGMPFGVTWRQLFASSWLAGIGFTMSLFIANLAFDSAALLSTAKIGILVASVLAGCIGFALVILTSPVKEGFSKLEPTPAGA
jgi:NhaA family Na+:H+ antiporter